MIKYTAFVAMVICTVPLWADPARASSGDEPAIRSLYAKYDAAWSKADAKAMGMLWAEDADHVEPDGRMIKGRAALETELARRFATDLKGTRSVQTVGSVRFIKADVAVVDASYEVFGAHDAEGKALPAIEGRYVDIWVKHRGTWRIVVDRPVAVLGVSK